MNFADLSSRLLFGSKHGICAVPMKLCKGGAGQMKSHTSLHGTVLTFKKMMRLSSIWMTVIQ